jgi:excisionase family DNA binding protein
MMQGLKESMPDDWLSLGDVAQVLGVHPSTVRSWSDQELLPVHRTSGGHRRYLRGEIELWVQSRRQGGADDANMIVQNALRATRFHVTEGRLQAEPWYCKLDDEAREQYRVSGRALLEGLSNYLNSAGAQAAAEAEAIGYEYASRGRRYGMGTVDATHAFLFFRNTLFESMLSVYEAAAVRSPHAWSSMFRKISAFTDTILITILETYEVYQRGEPVSQKK